MLVGQNPGWNEDQEGRPFIGQAGQYLDSLLFQAGIPRTNVCIANLVHCLTSNNRTPTPAEIKTCSKWLDLELSVVRPRIIVAMGKPATDYLLPGNGNTMEHLHGKPVEVNGHIILPAYHPAAALRNTTLLRQCSEDFQVLRGLAKGRDVSEYHVRDEYPNPVYRVVDTPEKMTGMCFDIEQAGEFAIDTEQCRGRLWSVQISCKEGESYFIPIKDDHRGKVDLSFLKAKAIVHYYLHDIQYLDLPDDFADTMTMAYLLGHEQGLKELASRLCGINMKTYREVVRSGQRELSMQYLTKASKQEWPDPPLIEETKWNNKEGRLVTRNKKPWHISRKVDNILRDMESNPEVDPYDRWCNIPTEERAVVESVLGPMPESSLADIPMREAVAYASRDSDATLRVYHKLSKMIDDLDLNVVLDMDLKVLPMVDSMMRNGMAVDVGRFCKLSEDYDIRMRVKAAELAGMVGHAFNPNSRPQVATVIYSELGFKPTAYTPSKEISTDDAELKKTGHPVAESIIRYRGLQKLKSTYADNMIRSAHSDSEGVMRVHTKINTTRVETGRLSSSKTDDGEGGNFQNIPTRNKEAKAIKNGFVAPEGKVLAEGDLSQIEMVTLAHLSKCKRLIEMFLRGGDPHTEMAATIFGVAMDIAKQDKYRYPIKRLNFGVAYLIGAQGLSSQINEYIADLRMEGETVDIEPWDVPTCEKFLTEWYRLNPEVKDFQLEMAAMARRLGYVTDIVGRMRYIPEVFCPVRSVQEAGLRMAANMPVTSSAQAVIKMAMGRLWRDLPRTEWSGNVRWLMQIHDSLIVEIPDDEEFYLPYLRWMHGIMCNVVSLRVPVKADFKVGKRWGELEKISL